MINPITNFGNLERLKTLYAPDGDIVFFDNQWKIRHIHYSFDPNEF